MDKKYGAVLIPSDLFEKLKKSKTNTYNIFTTESLPFLIKYTYEGSDKSDDEINKRVASISKDLNNKLKQINHDNHNDNITAIKEILPDILKELCAQTNICAKLNMYKKTPWYFTTKPTGKEKTSKPGRSKSSSPDRKPSRSGFSADEKMRQNSNLIKKSLIRKINSLKFN